MNSVKLKNNSYRNVLISLILPLIMVLYLLYMGAANGHISLTGVDGEYVYLLNGLNISTFRFNNIGFTDHPGTPFLVLTGIFLRLAHLLFGHGNIIDDVIARPDFYLKTCSMFMLALTTLVLIWGGKKIIDRTKNITAMFFIQGSYFLSEIVLSMQLRFIVDRLLPLVAFVFSVYTILFLYNEISEKKYSILSGLILGFGFISKFNFVVLSIIPPLILHRKYWLRYVLSFIVAAFLSFLPVIEKFGNAKNFILKLFFNKGTYGGGEQGIFEVDKFVPTLSKLYDFGGNFVWFFILSFICVIIYLLYTKEKRKKGKETLFLVGFLIASILITLMVSKNFKNYYLIPILGLSGIVTFLAIQLISDYFRLNKQIRTIFSIAIFGILFIPTIGRMNALKKYTEQKKQARLETKKFIKKNIETSNYWFLEPGWLSGPFEVNGLLWGICYISGKNDFTENYMRLYPQILTYEGDNRPIKQFRTKDAEIDKIFKDNSSVYMFSSPGRRTKQLQQELIKQSESLELKVALDTIFTNTENKDRIIKATFHKMRDTVAYVTNYTFNDMENKYKRWQQNTLTEDFAYSGVKSSKMKKGERFSSIFRHDSIPQFSNSLNSISVSCKYYQTGLKNNTQLVIELFNTKDEQFWYPVFCVDYFKTLNNWDNFSYKIYVPKKFKATQKLNVYFFNSKKDAVFIDDITIEIKGEKNKLNPLEKNQCISTL